MGTTQWILVSWIILMGLVQFGRGCARSVREYTMLDGIGGLIECALMIWLVASL